MVTDEEIAAAMLTHPEFSTRQLAKFLGTREHFIQYRMTRPGFAYRVAILRNSGFADAASTGAAGMSEVLDVLRTEMRSETNFSGERIQAAKGYADVAIKCHKIAKQDIEILRLRAFVEENERKRTGGLALDWSEGEAEASQLSPIERSEANGGVSVESVPVEEIEPGEQNQGSEDAPRELSPEVQRRLLDIVSKTTGE